MGCPLRRPRVQALPPFLPTRRSAHGQAGRAVSAWAGRNQDFPPPQRHEQLPGLKLRQAHGARRGRADKADQLAPVESAPVGTRVQGSAERPVRAPAPPPIAAYLTYNLTMSTPEPRWPSLRHAP
jgi:hypothetical protein